MSFYTPLRSIFGTFPSYGLHFPPLTGRVIGTNHNDTLDLTYPVKFLDTKSGDDTVTLQAYAYKVTLGRGDDTLLAEDVVGRLDAGAGDDDVTLMDVAGKVALGRGDDSLLAEKFVSWVTAGRGDDVVTLKAGAGAVDLGRGSDLFTADDFVFQLDAGRGNDAVTLNSGGSKVELGRGDDTLTLGELVSHADGGRGTDALEFTFDAGGLDIAYLGGEITFIDRVSGETMLAEGFETLTFADRSFDLDDLEDAFGPGALPYIQVAGGTQAVTVNNVDPTISVIWDRVVQQAVIETASPTGPTVASRAYAMVHTAIYDAWSAYDATATHVSLDLEGDNIEASGTEAQMEKAMSFAALTVLRALFPDMEPLFAKVMTENLGFALSDDGSLEAQIGIDAAEDLLALRLGDGSNQAGGYLDTTGYVPVNPGPNQTNDIAAWTPENVPVDPEDDNPEQTFLTPHWQEVEGFALAENPGGETDFSNTLPPAPDAFFTAEFSDATLDFAAKTITLGSDAMIGGMSYSAGDEIAVGKDLIGEVINPNFIAQAEEVIAYSANLTDEEKIIAEFWEDGGGTAFPPGTFMTFGQFVSARDGHTIAEDAKMFLMMGNAVMDAGIATWQSKVEYDYVRPVRAIRDLGELGLIGEMGVDELTGETGYVIEAFGGFAEDGTGFGTRTILAENFITFQLPGGNVSPPFAEYTSGHSAFSASGAEVLRLVTGSDDFGGAVSFAPGSTIFEVGVPFEETILAWDTFSDAADEAGLSRLYGGIHFTDGDMFGRELGRTVGADAYELGQLFFSGAATDADRPFGLEDIPLG